MPAGMAPLEPDSLARDRTHEDHAAVRTHAVVGVSCCGSCRRGSGAGRTCFAGSKPSWAAGDSRAATGFSADSRPQAFRNAFLAEMPWRHANRMQKRTWKLRSPRASSSELIAIATGLFAAAQLAVFLPSHRPARRSTLMGGGAVRRGRPSCRSAPARRSAGGRLVPPRRCAAAATELATIRRHKPSRRGSHSEIDGR